MSGKDVVRQIRKATRRSFSSEEKIRIVVGGLRAETPVTELCRPDAREPLDRVQ
jgi:transposase